SSAKPYVSPTSEISDCIYVVLTMRSDFLGDCASFPGVTEAINNGLYLTPHLNLEQLRAAIEEPALVFGGQVEAELVVELLEDAGNNPDQLPLLQHVLMRLWRLSKNKILTLTQYKKKGGLKNALSDHADNIFFKLTPEQQKIAEIMFRGLTERSSTQHDTRRPMKLADIASLSDVTWQDVKKIVEVFRYPGRCFLMPPHGIDLTPESMIDISHESLIRQWQQLKKWTEDEAENAKTYQRLEDRAIEWQKHKASLLHTLELEIFLQWYEDKKPNKVWARRYGQHFKLAEQFLLESKENEDKSENAVYCDQYIKRFGAIYPYPGSELTEEQVKRRSRSIKLIRKGKRNPFYKMQIINGFC
ncbi:MAG: hypothetical protein D3910_26295, partial [Candidatus Electrothrix sp. ATG2]|nr:hypothetical protein [Candidatus Electrothrix sp. ATG2]